MKLHVTSGACQARASCADCQDPGPVGRMYRLTRRAAGYEDLPADGSPLTCPHPRPLTAAGVIHGAVGLAKAAVGVGRASEEVVEARRLACTRCAQWTGATCQLCGCVTQAKTANASEACPLGWWLAT